MKWYGNLNNRVEEGKNYIDDKEIKVGTDITMYYWSDRTCYYVTDVIDQKHIKVREYEVCADHDKPGGMGHQDWMYFKTKREYNDYISKYFPDRYDPNIKEDEPEDWVFRYGHWRKAYNYDKKFLEEKYEDMKEFAKTEGELDTLDERFKNWVDVIFTEKEQKKLNEGKTVTHYYPLSGEISFGVRRYYYDWSF